MNKRIKKIRVEAGLSQDEFAARLGYKSRGKIANIEYGKTNPDAEFLNLLCREFDVNRAWIDSGDGEMYRRIDRDEEIASFIGKILGDEDAEFQRGFVSALSRLSVDEWAVLEGIVKKMAGIDDVKKET